MPVEIIGGVLIFERQKNTITILDQIIPATINN